MVERSPVRERVDLEQHVALLNQRPFLEVDLVQIAPDAGAQLDGIDGGRAAGEVHIVGDVPLDGVAHHDR